MKKALITLSIVTSFVLFSGCASKVGYFKSVAVQQADINTSATASIAVDFMDFIAVYHPAAKTTFLIDPISKSSNFLSSMETQLRQRGYGITYDKNVENAIPLAWKADSTNQSVVRVTFNIGSGNVSRLYTYDQDVKSFTPYGMFTVRDLGERYYDDFTEPEHHTVIPPKIVEPKPNNESSIQSGTVKVQPNSSLNIREESTIKSAIIGKLSLGSNIMFRTIEINTHNEKWIKLENIQGFVSADYVILKG